MKFCPTCETRYDEEILRFCTKDGAPLIDENQPNFTEMPSNSIETPEDDLGEETMVRYKPPKDILPEPEPAPDVDRSEAPRIVIPMSEQKKEQQVRSRAIPPYQPPAPKSSTGKVVVLTVLGTLAILAMGLGVFVLLRNDDAGNKNVMNVNTNPPDLNINSNLNLGGINYNVPAMSNYNVNSSYNSNTNVNLNYNANLRTPTPTPKPSPSPNANANVNANLGNINVISTPTPKPSVTPTTPSASPKPSTPNATPKPASPTPDRSGKPPANN